VQRRSDRFVHVRPRFALSSPQIIREGI
jgi:hypothetical protein